MKKSVKGEKREIFEELLSRNLEMETETGTEKSFIIIVRK